MEGEGEEKQFGMVSLRLIKASTVCPDFSVRTMRIKYLNSQSNTGKYPFISNENIVDKMPLISSFGVHEH